MNKFLKTDESSWALAAQRTALGLVIFPHGAQKLFGWFGGYGFEGTIKFFTDALHIPAPIAFLVILGESLGAVMLVLGLATRLSAIGISLIMAGAVLTTHIQNGFFMNWFGNQPGEGFEFHLLALSLGIPLAIWGGGRHALDTMIQARLEAPSASEAARVRA